MRLRDDSIREALAAEFVLGTLSARVRKRFQNQMRYDAGLRTLVYEWEQRLTPMASSIPELQPPANAWTSIAARIRAGRERARSNPVRQIRFWRTAAVAMTFVLVIGLGYFGANRMLAEPQPDMMAVLSDNKSEPALLVSWPLRQTQNKHIKVRVIAHPDMPADTSWELWLIPADRMDRPVSAGFVGMAPLQTLPMSGAAADALSNAWGFAVSVEPKGGSPTGAPTGPVIFRGPCVKLIGA